MDPQGQLDRALTQHAIANVSGNILLDAGDFGVDCLECLPDFIDLTHDIIRFGQG